VGTVLLESLVRFDANAESIRKDLIVSKGWTDEIFREVENRLRRHQPKTDTTRGDMERLRSLLLANRDFLLRLLQNPNLLEHEAFTDLLWSVFHLADELAHRKDLGTLSTSDREHLAADMDRALRHLIGLWIAYMKHLQESYPYLFSLALRTNPFDPDAKPEVT
jgi:hypothetical protein